MLSGFSSTPRSRRTARPFPERLETRSLLSGYSPTAIEQLYLEELDDARFNPAAYGQSLGLDLSNVAPSQPLAMNTSLVESARLHSQDMIAQNYFSHISPQGLDPGQRIQAAGLNPMGYAESIETDTNPIYSTTPASLAGYAASDTGFSLSNLIVDQGVPDLGHRVMLLDIGGQLLTDRQVGIGIASQDTSSGGFSYVQTDTTIDIAATTNTNPFLTGVVFDDSAGNGEYQPGEGLGGVTISVSNGSTTTTLDAGGYSMQVTPGIYTVTASGGGLPAPIARTVVVGNNNVRLNFVENANGTSLNAGSGGLVSGQLGSFTPFQSGDTASSYSVRIDWGDGNASSGTLTTQSRWHVRGQWLECLCQYRSLRGPRARHASQRRPDGRPERDRRCSERRGRGHDSRWLGEWWHGDGPLGRGHQPDRWQGQASEEAPSETCGEASQPSRSDRSERARRYTLVRDTRSPSDGNDSGALVPAHPLRSIPPELRSSLPRISAS